MPWVANNNQAGELRLPSHAAFLKNASASLSPMQTFRAQLYEHHTPFCVYLHPSHATPSSSALFVYPRTYPQFVSQVSFLEGVPADSIWCSAEQLVNLELCDDQEATWRWYNSTQDPIAASITFEVRPLDPSTSDNEDDGAAAAMCVIDTEAVTAQLLKLGDGKILTENERVVLHVNGVALFLRVVHLEGHDPNETEFTMPHVYRGRMDAATTTVHLIKENPDADEYELTKLATTESLPPSFKGSVVDVWTNDDEMFPVKKKLLWPCIKLTSAVMAGHGVHKDKDSVVHVDVDCLTFDRVLLYLEHIALYPDEPFQFDPHFTDGLLHAARTVGCQGLEDLCKMKMGEFESRVRKQAIKYNYVVERNLVGNEFWLIMDGMVLDITRWLPEHPGGSELIPKEALNVDCVGMFEVYHASKASFRYLKQFYIGELGDKERQLCPNGHTHKDIPIPSVGFMDEFKRVRRRLSRDIVGVTRLSVYHVAHHTRRSRAH
ncbi:Aste57867_21329 [Aphanomyces stellatus]|uniref:Aste57867_21329 protein n=1 Tax=Aphanomyces stellatus TaxID=120398 RepID=A0A485LIM7_9STRA|nr:hypothetical protein As57867_021260 [Aphanomyces stellatus]VFT98001.1 Aste57867_21329 [Aphanomyces stellatus]